MSRPQSNPESLEGTENQSDDKEALQPQETQLSKSLQKHADSLLAMRTV